MISLLSIGIGDYRTATQIDPDVTDLDYGVSDAIRFAEVASATLAVKSLRILTSEASPEGRATRLNIIRSVLEAAAERSDVAVVYFAGHGIDINGALHLCPEDYDPRVPEHSAISASFMVGALAANTSWSLIVLDACRSVGARPQRGRRGRGAGRTGVVYVADNVCIMLGCSNGEQAVETPSVDGQPAGGLFTHFFCENLLQTPSNVRTLSLADLFERTQAATSLYATTELDHLQTPRAVGLSPHDVYLGCNRRRRRGDPLPVHPLLRGGNEDASPGSSQDLASAPLPRPLRDGRRKPAAREGIRLLPGPETMGASGDGKPG